MSGIPGRTHQRAILITGTKVRSAGRGKKSRTVLTLACMDCGEIFETEGYSVQHVMDSTDLHIKKTGS